LVSSFSAHAMDSKLKKCVENGIYPVRAATVYSPEGVYKLDMGAIVRILKIRHTGDVEVRRFERANQAICELRVNEDPALIPGLDRVISICTYELHEVMDERLVLMGTTRVLEFGGCELKL
jgi:hypothetical protein